MSKNQTLWGSKDYKNMHKKLNRKIENHVRKAVKYLVSKYQLEGDDNVMPLREFNKKIHKLLGITSKSKKESKYRAYIDRMVLDILLLDINVPVYNSSHMSQSMERKVH